MHEQGRSVACRDQIVQDLDLGALERLTKRVGLEHGGNRRERRKTFGEELRHGHRGLENPRRMDHVAEIQNAADGALRRVDQQILSVAIAMNGLAAQRAERSEVTPQ